MDKLLEKKNARLEEIKAEIEKAESVDAVRALMSEADELRSEIATLKAETEKRQQNFKPMDTYTQNKKEERDMSDKFATMEYRNAFMNYVTNRAVSTTSDVTNVIPTPVANRIFERIEETGIIMNRVTKTNHPVGMSIPKAGARPKATWVNEGAGSTPENLTTAGYITFSHHKLRCEIGMTLEADVMSLSAFETYFVESVSRAMVDAIEQAIIMGDGNTMPKGILTETGRKVNIAGDVPTYEEFYNVEAAIKSYHEANSVWIMTKANFMKAMALTDENGQPIGRVNMGGASAGIANKSILGREVIVVPYEIKGLTTDNYGVVVNLSDFVLNFNYNITISEKSDWDTEDRRRKAVAVLDGKMLDDTSIIKVAKTAS